MRWLRNLFSRPDDAAPPPAAEPAPGAAAQPPAAPGSDWASHQRLGAAGPVGIAVDLALAARAPVADRPRLARVRCALKDPRPDGQPQGAELEALAEVEDVVAEVLAPLGAIYAGRVTQGGFREHLLYLPDAAPVAEALAHARARLAAYDLEQTGEDDLGWHAYLEELHPTPRALRFLLDRRALEALGRAAGPAPRPVDHQASFPTAEARAAFAGAAVALGFEVVASRDDAPAPAPFAIDLRREDPLVLKTFTAVTWSLEEAARANGGTYDGWAPAENGAQA